VVRSSLFTRFNKPATAQAWGWKTGERVFHHPDLPLFFLTLTRTIAANSFCTCARIMCMILTEMGTVKRNVVRMPAYERNSLEIRTADMSAPLSCQNKAIRNFSRYTVFTPLTTFVGHVLQSLSSIMIDNGRHRHSMCPGHSPEDQYRHKRPCRKPPQHVKSRPRPAITWKCRGY